MSMTALREELKEKPKAIRQHAQIIQEAISFHRAWVDRTADQIVWDNTLHLKTGGSVVLEEMIGLEKDSEKKQRLQEDLAYWNANYDSIRKHVYQCDQ